MFFLPSYQSQPGTADDSIGNALGTHRSAARVFYPYTHGLFQSAVSQPEDCRYRTLLRQTEQTSCVVGASWQHVKAPWDLDMWILWCH